MLNRDIKPPLVSAGREAWLKRELAWRLRRPMTPSEKRLWQHLRAGRLAGLQVRRQQVIEGFIADFYLPTARLAVEVDGGVHATRTEYDQERTRIFLNCDIITLRFTHTQVDTDIYAVTAAIRIAALKRL